MHGAILLQYTLAMWPALGLLLQLAATHQSALDAYRQHRLADAAAQFEAVLKTERPGTPEYGESVLLLGQSLYLQGKYGESIPWLEKAAAVKGAPVEAAYMLGNACLLTRRADRALAAYAQLFQVDPKSAAAHLATARMMMRQEMDDDAAAQARAALELDSRIPEAHFLLGEVALFHGDFDVAAAELQKEIALNPGYAMAYYRLGDAYGRKEQWQEAIAPLERSVWLNPNYSGPYILLGKAYLKQKEFANAEGVLRHALRLDPQNLSAHYLLAQALQQEGKSEEAGREFARWKELKGEP